MSDGATTAGSIVGKLRLDKAQWDADVAAAKADARELGAMDPTVRVDANVGDAVAKLESVRVAEAGVADGNNNMGNTAGGAASRMALIAGAIAALIPVTTALAGYAVGVSGALAGMGAAGVLAVLGIKNAMADGTAVGDQFSAGLQVADGYLQQLEQTATAGVLNGFVSSLSIVGAAMPQLNQEIGLFSTQLSAVATFITQGVVSALEVLNPLFVQAGAYIEQVTLGLDRWTSDGGLQKFTQQAEASLPQVAAALGSLVKGALDLIGAFSGAGPLLLDVVTILGQLLSVVSLMGPVLPTLAVGALAAFGAFKGWQAIAPILGSVQAGVANLMTSMGALEPMTEAQIALSGTYTDLLATEAGVMDAVAAGEDAVTASTEAASTAFEAATGPIGIVLAIVGGLAAAFLTSAAAQQTATSATRDYTTAVQQDNGVIGENVKAQAAKALSDSKALDTAQQLGISMKVLTDATTGNGAAQDKLKTKIDALNAQLVAMDKANADAATHGGAQTAAAAKLADQLQSLTTQYEAQKTSITGAIKAYNDIANAQGVSTISTKAQLQAQTDLAAEYGVSLPALLAAEGAQKGNADQAAATTLQLQLENDAAGLLTNAFNLLNGTNLSVAQAQTAAAGATNTLTDSLKTNGLTIDGNSKAAVANQQALEGKAAADQAAAEAIAKQTGSTQAGTAAFAASKAAIEQQLKATGQLTPAIQALIDKYYAIPPVVKTKAELDADAAAKKAADLAAKLAALPRFIPVTVQMTGVTTGAPILAGTNGGRAFFADGGTTHAAGGLTVPGQSRPYGDSVSMMLAPSEEVISNRNGQADQNRGLLKLVNSGASHAQIAGYANRQAGTTGGGGGGGDITVTVVNKTGVTLSDLIDVQVQRNNQRQKMGLTAGRQKGSF